MNLLSIKSEADYNEAIMHYLKLCRAPEGSLEWAVAELLKIFIEEYEKNESQSGIAEGHFPGGEC